jgi:hypothetical protein
LIVQKQLNVAGRNLKLRKITKTHTRLLRTKSDEVYDLERNEMADLLSLILEKLEELDCEDYFGTEGWQRGLFGVD